MLRERISFLKFLSIVIALGVLVSAPGSGSVQAAPGKNPQHTNVVISEFRTRGPDPNGTTNEFIEVFNPTTLPIDISGWGILPSDQTGLMPSAPIYIFPSSPDPHDPGIRAALPGCKYQLQWGCGPRRHLFI